jgi:hypothetical protein
MVRGMFASILVTAAAVAHAGLLDDMVALDRAYVPVLALTNQTGKDAESRAAMSRFDAAWRVFLSAPSAKADTSLAGVLNESEGRIVRAREEIRVGNLKAAHESLEHLRRSFWKWRAGKGITYFPDALTAYHDEMERVADAATHATNAGKLPSLLAVARARWLDLERSTFDAKLHGFDESKVARLKGLMGRERAALEEISALGPGGERGALTTAAKNLKGTFAQIYFLFGDFAAN